MNTKDITDQEVKEFQNLLSYFKQFSNGGITGVIEKWLLDMLDETIKFHSYLTLHQVFPEIERMTINRHVVGKNKRIKDINYLKYPPADKVTKYGRCNLPLQSVFYGSFNIMVTMNEMRPEVGDLITRTKWRVRSDEPIKYCPIFMNQPHEENIMNDRTWAFKKQFEQLVEREFPKNTRQLVLDLNQFVADCFSKWITTDNHRDYLFSAYFSDLILNKIEDGSIDAIYYPSVKEDLSFENIAIKPTVFDRKYSLVKVDEDIVVGTPEKTSYGYSLEGISDCTSFDYTTGKILWDIGEYTQPDFKIQEYKDKYGIDIESH